MSVPRNQPSLDDEIEDLLADPSYQGHPLRDALARLWSHSLEQLERLEKIANASLIDVYDKELGRLEKAARISDRYQEILRELNQQLDQASVRDRLTGLANRRMLSQRLEEETKRAERLGYSLSVALVDADGFKSINKSYGPQVGDLVLVQLARAMEAELRKYDLCGRWDGEEFLIVLPQTELNDAIKVMDRLRQRVQAARLGAGDTHITITVSAGITLHKNGDPSANTIRRANLALQEGKQAGKNRTNVG